MSRRHRLALRQVAEAELVAALSDVEDVATEDPVVAEPNFNLLGMMMPAETDGMARTTSLHSVLPTASSHTADADGGEDMEETATQELPSSTPQNGASQVTKKARLASDRAIVRSAGEPSSTAVAGTPVIATDDSRGVFQLYQTGLCEDHTLQLHFIRRRPPPPPVARVEDEFVLPRPQLTLLDLLPPDVLRVDDILRVDAVKQESPLEKNPFQTADEVVQTATRHWRQLSAASEETTTSWRGMQESEWRQVYEASGSFVPSADDLSRLLELLHSDAFASFVWHELLVTCLLTSDHDPPRMARLAQSLLSHDHFRRLPAKEFRTQLRAKNLRTLLPSTGAAIEMELITQFHHFRNPDLPHP